MLVKIPKLRWMSTLLVALIMQLAAYASPQIEVRGRVTSDNGDPVQGASVVEKGSTTGTSTNASGEFILNVPGTATLVISSVGFETQEVAVGNRTSLTVSLKRTAGKMDEIVVIGYGTAAKRDLTGSITKVSGKEIADKPNVNPVSSLQGKVAGLSVVPGSSPGDAPDIRIRGTVSLGSIRPVYVVDGILNDCLLYTSPSPRD